MVALLQKKITWRHSVEPLTLASLHNCISNVLYCQTGYSRTSWFGLRSLCSCILGCFACLPSGSHWRLLAMAAVVSYTPPWWVHMLHRLPHFNLQFEQTSSDFRPEDWTYQQVKKQKQKTDLNHSSPSGRIVWESVSQSARYCMSVFIFISEIIGDIQLCLPHRSLNYTFLFLSLATDPLAPVPSPHLFDPCHHLCVSVAVVLCLDLWQTPDQLALRADLSTRWNLKKCRSADLSVLYGSNRLIPLYHFWCLVFILWVFLI